MLQSMEKMMMAGLGAISMTKEKAEKMFDEYVKRGEAARESKEGFVSELMEYAEKNRRQVEEILGRQLKKTLDSMDVPTKSDLDRVEKKVDRLLKQQGAK